MIAPDGASSHVNWVLIEAAMEGLTALFSNLWRETHSLFAGLLYLVRPNSREKWAWIDWSAEYVLIPMH